MRKTEEPRVNTYECCGCGLCAIALPEAFRLTIEGKAEVYAADKAEKSSLQTVINDCPMMCIHWHNNKKQ